MLNQNDNSSSNTANETRKNLKIIKKFSDASKQFADAVLLTGSNAWGQYYAVNENSDIDLVVTATDIKQLESVIERYVSLGLLEEYQKQRFDLYKRLYHKKKAEDFSICAKYKNKTISIDFITLDVIKTIAGLKPLITRKHKDTKGVINIRAFNEFRSNPPRKTGYSVDELGGRKKITYYPKFKEILDRKGKTAGYLSETLIDAKNSSKGNESYFLGVISFFFAVHPIVIFDSNGQLTASINILNKNIKKLIGKKKIVYITRQERMSESIQKQIKDSFTN